MGEQAQEEKEQIKKDHEVILKKLAQVNAQ